MVSTDYCSSCILLHVRLSNAQTNFSTLDETAAIHPTVKEHHVGHRVRINGLNFLSFLD